MKPTPFEIALAFIDAKNAEDPNVYNSLGIVFPKELLYAKRMYKKLLQFKPNASQALQIAARAQHICRWKIARNNYPMTRVGYLKWRETLKIMHANITANILKEVGYDADFIEKVSYLIHKKNIKENEESQVLEDVICLIFLEFYFEEFASKHPDNKVIEILKKTWLKMSNLGHAEALKLKFSNKSLALVKQAISLN